MFFFPKVYYLRHVIVISMFFLKGMLPSADYLDIILNNTDWKLYGTSVTNFLNSSLQKYTKFLRRNKNNEIVSGLCLNCCSSYFVDEEHDVSILIFLISDLIS